MIPQVDTAKETDYPKICPLYNQETDWMSSARGKHILQHCPSHGFVSIRIHPVFRNEMKSPTTLKGKLKEWWGEFLRTL